MRTSETQEITETKLRRIAWTSESLYREPTALIGHGVVLTGERLGNCPLYLLSGSKIIWRKWYIRFYFHIL